MSASAHGKAGQLTWGLVILGAFLTACPAPEEQSPTPVTPTPSPSPEPEVTATPTPELATPTAEPNFVLTVLHHANADSKLINAETDTTDTLDMSPYGGAHFFADRIRYLRQLPMGAEDSPLNQVVLISGGETIRAGTEFSASTASGVPYYDSLVIEELDYSVVALGPQDFDFGSLTLANFLIALVDNPGLRFIGTNLDFNTENTALATVERSLGHFVVLHEGRDNPYVGVLNVLTPDLPIVTSPSPVTVSSWEDSIVLTQAYIDYLKYDQETHPLGDEAPEIEINIENKVDILILIGHMNNVNDDLAFLSQLRGVDLFISAADPILMKNSTDKVLPIPKNTLVRDGYPQYTPDLDGDEIPWVSTLGRFQYVGRIGLEYFGKDQPLGIRSGSGPIPVTHDNFVIDSDNDRIYDAFEVDSDNDGISDVVELQNTTLAVPLDSDGDGNADFRDSDSDDDGLLDKDEDINLNGSWEPLLGETDARAADSDGGGISDFYELAYDMNPNSASDDEAQDPDHDGIPTKAEQDRDRATGNDDDDGDGISNPIDSDSDNDCIPNLVECCGDLDGDNRRDHEDPDSDGDLIPDLEEYLNNKKQDPLIECVATPVDTDKDSIPNYQDTDSDNDGIPDRNEYSSTTFNHLAQDTDGGGIHDNFEDLNLNGKQESFEGNPVDKEDDVDTDHDGWGDEVERQLGIDSRDPDVDGDGIPDSLDGWADLDGDGEINAQDLDSDDDFVLDSDEQLCDASWYLPGTQYCDMDLDGIPDYIDPPDEVLDDPPYYDNQIYSWVVLPVWQYVQSLSRIVFARSEVLLDGSKANVRTRETNLGDLLADAILWSGQLMAESDVFGELHLPPAVALVNGGAIRASMPQLISGAPPWDLTKRDLSDAFSLSSFVAVLYDVPYDTLKAALENGVSKVESADGRFLQVAGLRYEWNPAGTPRQVDSNGNVLHEGNRIVNVTLLDEEGTVIVQDGIVQTSDCPPQGCVISIATLDFVARGGDNSPFAGMEYTTLGFWYQDVFLDYVTTSLGAALIKASLYPENPTARIAQVSPSARTR